MKEKKTHLYFDSEERKLLLHSLVELILKPNKTLWFY